MADSPLMILMGGPGPSEGKSGSDNDLLSRIKEKMGSSEKESAPLKDRRPEEIALMAEFDDKALNANQRLDALKLLIDLIKRK